jgi:hypothetical protein
MQSMWLQMTGSPRCVQSPKKDTGVSCTGYALHDYQYRMYVTSSFVPYIHTYPPVMLEIGACSQPHANLSVDRLVADEPMMKASSGCHPRCCK